MEPDAADASVKSQLRLRAYVRVGCIRGMLQMCQDAWIPTFYPQWSAPACVISATCDQCRGDRKGGVVFVNGAGHPGAERSEYSWVCNRCNGTGLKKGFKEGSHGRIFGGGKVARCGGPGVCPDCWVELQGLDEDDRAEWLRMNQWSPEMVEETKAYMEDAE